MINLLPGSLINSPLVTPSIDVRGLIAALTGIATWAASGKIGNATQLQEVYERIDQLETSEIKTTILYHTEIRPLFHYLAIAAFALLLLAQAR